MPVNSALHVSVPYAEILRRLSPRFRIIIDLAAVLESVVDLLVFETGDGHVVASRDLEKALRKYRHSSRLLVVVGHDFTQEVRIAIDERGGKVCSERNFGWTDERWNLIKQR